MATPVIFERRTTRRIACRATVGRFSGQFDARILNLSLEGVAIQSSVALAVGQTGVLELRHPQLTDAISIGVTAVWCRLGEGQSTPEAGLYFPSVNVSQRNSLRRFLAAEAGSCILVGSESVGFLVGTAEGMWSVFGTNATKIAYINRESPGCYHTATGVGADPRLPPRYHQSPTLIRAVSAACMRTAPRLEPPVHDKPRPVRAPAIPAALREPARTPLPPPKPDDRRRPPRPRAAPAEAKVPEKPPQEPTPKPEPLRTMQPWEEWASRKEEPKSDGGHVSATASDHGETLVGSCVKAGGKIVGYVALTGPGVWSLYDPDMEHIGLLSRAGSGYTVYWFGETAESSCVFVAAESYPAAIAVAFDLDELPGLSSAPISAKAQSTEIPKPNAKAGGMWGSKVVFRRKLVGYVCESAMDDTWAILSKTMEQIAILNRDTFPPYRFRAVLMGSSIEESMEYLMHPEFVGAVGQAFSLPGIPLIDPPIAIPEIPEGLSGD